MCPRCFGTKVFKVIGCPDKIFCMRCKIISA